MLVDLFILMPVFLSCFPGPPFLVLISTLLQDIPKKIVSFQTGIDK